jgi:hypothetical protein
MISSGPLESSLQVILPKNNPEFEVKAVVAIIRRLQSSKQPVILVDGGMCLEIFTRRDLTYTE